MGTDFYLPENERSQRHLFSHNFTEKSRQKKYESDLSVSEDDDDDDDCNFDRFRTWKEKKKSGKLKLAWNKKVTHVWCTEDEKFWDPSASAAG